MPRIAQPLLERILSKVRKTDSCWIWSGATSSNGYGVANVGGHIHNKRSQPAHRAVYELLVGKIAKGKEIDHLCRVTLCVNPAHLEAVTHTENIRRSRGTKLNMEIANLIKHATGTQKQIALQYGTDQSTVSRIKNNKKWRVA